MTRVLVVDDEPQIVRALVINLKARKYEVDAAPDGATALQLAAARHPDVVVLDLGLPDMDGVDVIRGLRGWTRVPILVLSARHTSDEKVEALDAGADDYVTKPFGMDELLARLRASVRRAEPVGQDGGDEVVLVETEGFTVDLAAKKVHREGRDVRLTPTEWHLLEVLVRNSGRIGQPEAVAPGGLGALVRHRDQLSAGLHGPAEAQAGGRPLAPPALRHRTRDGLPLRACLRDRDRGAAPSVRVRRRPPSRTSGDRYPSGMSAVPRFEKSQKAERPSGRFRRMLDRLSSSQEDLECEELEEDSQASGCTRISECSDRQIVKVTGTLRTVTLRPRAGVPALEAELFDGTAPLDVVWLGRRSIMGIEPGRKLIASGRIAMSHGRRVLFNPKYELRPLGKE